MSPLGAIPIPLDYDLTNQPVGNVHVECLSMPASLPAAPPCHAFPNA